MENPLDDVDRIKGIADPAERAREIGRVLDALRPVTAELRRLRQAAVVEMQGRGLSLAAIAEELGRAKGTVQQIAEGRTRGGKPVRKLDEPDS